jgi:hypothetical protein
MELFIHLYLLNFIRTVVIIAAIYFIIRLFTRYILPIILDKKIKDMHEKMQNQQKQQHRTNRSEGDVTIEYNDSRNKNRNQGNGEYVDFEEVE